MDVLRLSVGMVNIGLVVAVVLFVSTAQPSVEGAPPFDPTQPFVVAEPDATPRALALIRDRLPTTDDIWWIAVFAVAPVLTLALLWRDRDPEIRLLRSKLRTARLRKRLSDLEPKSGPVATADR